MRVERSRCEGDKVCDTTASGNTCTCTKQHELHANVTVVFAPLQSTQRKSLKSVPTTDLGKFILHGHAAVSCVHLTTDHQKSNLTRL